MLSCPESSPLAWRSHAASAFFPSPFNEAADLNYDGVIDILDVVIILNIILGIDG